jgi:hypothetical protein
LHALGVASGRQRGREAWKRLLQKLHDDEAFRVQLPVKLNGWQLSPKTGWFFCFLYLCFATYQIVGVWILGIYESE